MFGFVKDLFEWLWPTKPTEPWREASYCNKENEALLDELHRLQQDTKRNILILGPTGAGKSSFINSVMSIDKGRKYGMAVSGDRVFGSWTRDFAAYSGDKLLKGCRLFDCMGIEQSEKKGILLDDLMFLIKGHIKKGYKFNPDKPINKRNSCYRSEPTFADQMHCAIFVVSADFVRCNPNEDGHKIRELQLKLRDENIPRIMILTQVDLICDEVATDETKMFKCRKVHYIVNLASELFGIEKASIHPVVNYVGDFNIRPERNVPILLALRQAMHYSEDRVDYFEHENSDDGDSVVKQNTCFTTECDPPGVFEVMAEDYIFNIEIVDWKFPQEWCKTNGDPFIKLAFTKAPDAVRESSVSKQDFQFFLKENEGNEMEISLMKGKEKKGDIISSKKIPLQCLKQLEKKKMEKNIHIDKDVTIKVVMSAKIDTQLLIGHDLCDEEKDYIKKRQSCCLRTMEEVFKDNAPSGKNLVPIIAVMGSGGGFRAVTAFSGAMSALVRSKVADMVMYNVGLSGSAWYLSTLYSHPDWPQEKSAIDLRSELRKCIVSRLSPILFNPLNICQVLSDYSNSQTYSFTNVYGSIISEKLLQKRKNSTLTNQQGKVKKGLAPLPLYAALNVKRTTSAKVFHEWIEFSPFAIGMPKYGTFLKPELFGSKFCSGRLRREFDEFPLHFLLGIWGSAYCILLHRFIEKHKAAIFEKLMKHTLLYKITNDIYGRAAVVNNFMHCLKLRECRPYSQIETDGNLFSTPESTEGLFKELHEMKPTDAEKMYLVDAGLAFNSPFPLILRPEREVDLILSFDFSERESDKADPFTDLRLAAEWAKLHEIPFPDINTPEIGSEELKECYVFENPDDLKCPIVMHFILINNEFRKFKSPGVPRVTEEEKEFGNFDVFDDPDKPYSSIKYRYSERAFDRLADLMEFNTLLHEDTILNNISKCVDKRRKRVLSGLGKGFQCASHKNK